MTCILSSIQEWHQLARPSISEKAFNVQLGCHLEEIVEMLNSLEFSDPNGAQAVRGVFSASHQSLQNLAEGLKKGEYRARIVDRKEFADSIGDQIVTGMGAAYCANMDGAAIAERVDHSNWTKFVNGVPVFDENGKIAKPETYTPPDLTGTY